MIMDILNSLGMGMAVPIFGLILFGIVYAWRKKDRIMSAYHDLTGSIQDMSLSQSKIRDDLLGVRSDVKDLRASLECHMQNHSIHINGEDLVYRDVCRERHRAMDTNLTELRRKVFND